MKRKLSEILNSAVYDVWISCKAFKKRRERERKKKSRAYYLLDTNIYISTYTMFVYLYTVWYILRRLQLQVFNLFKNYVKIFIIISLCFSLSRLTLYLRCKILHLKDKNPNKTIRHNAKVKFYMSTFWWIFLGLLINIVTLYWKSNKRCLIWFLIVLYSWTKK